MGNFGVHPLLVGTCMFSFNNNLLISPISSPNNPIPNPSNSSFLTEPKGLISDSNNGSGLGKHLDERKQSTAVFDATLQPFNPSSPPRKKVRGGMKRKICEEKGPRSILYLEEDNWARFFMIKKKEGSFLNDCSFKLSQELKRLIGKTKSNRKMGDGTLCIEASTKEQAKKVLEILKISDNDVEVSPHKKLNTSQGVITCRDFLNSSVEDIKDGLLEEGVIEVRRIKRRQGDSLVDTASLVLTFDRPKPPTTIDAAFYKLKVRPYVPSPMRCFRCQRFGHTSHRCKATEEICICGKPSHEGECTPPIICVNCGGEHTAKANCCPVLLEEREIQKVKTLQQLPYQEARAIVRSKSYVKPQKSYAQAINIKSHKTLFKFSASPSKTSGQTTSGPSLAQREQIVKVGVVPPPPETIIPLSGAPVADMLPGAPQEESVAERLPKSPSAKSGRKTKVGRDPPGSVSPSDGEWRVAGTLRRAQKRGDKKSPYVRTSRRKEEKEKTVGDQRITKSYYVRRSPRPKWEMLGTDLEASESEGGGTSERPPSRKNGNSMRTRRTKTFTD